ncbi:Glycolipid transfer protein domain containing protein [Trema orientale]|uniref:Glycolipid transfer protein domain containing protein n=1 Tax=Trema orientale TaxID=63057 RepID=A0A2P5FL90_TREOI|nr:Glycolipid transfer protein domain containing protein [Trema orientale]
MAGTSRNPLRNLVAAFEELAGTVNSANPHINTIQLTHACRLFAPSKNFNFGFAFMFVDVELLNKEAAKTCKTIKALVEHDVAQGSAKVNSSPSRSLNRLKRVIEMVRIFFEQVLEDEGSDSIADPVIIAYNQVFAAYHGPTVREAVANAKDFLPTKSTLWNMLDEDDDSVIEPLEKYIAASRVVTQYIESIFLSNESTTELLRLI